MVPKGTKRFQKVPKGSNRYQTGPKGSTKYHRVPNGPMQSQKVPDQNETFLGDFQTLCRAFIYGSKMSDNSITVLYSFCTSSFSVILQLFPRPRT